MGEFGILLCGHNVAEGIAKNALVQLGQSIDNFSTRALKFLNEPATDDTLAFAPFCARVLLENACAALVGRLDSFRLLYLSEFQTQPEYEHGKRAKSSFSWFGDVIPPDGGGNTLWNIDFDTSKISRALFSRHLDHVYWRPAVDGLLDHVNTAGNPLLSEILVMESETFVASCKGKGSQLYSTLSKAVHWEFFSSVLVYDENTIKVALRDTILLVLQLGLVSHFIPTAYARVSPESAVGLYSTIRENIH